MCRELLLQRPGAASAWHPCENFDPPDRLQRHSNVGVQCGRKTGLVHPRTSITALGAGKVEPEHRLRYALGRILSGLVPHSEEPRTVDHTHAFVMHLSSPRRGSLERLKVMNFNY